MMVQLSGPGEIGQVSLGTLAAHKATHPALVCNCLDIGVHAIIQVSAWSESGRITKHLLNKSLFTIFFLKILCSPVILLIE